MGSPSHIISHLDPTDTDTRMLAPTTSQMPAPPQPPPAKAGNGPTAKASASDAAYAKAKAVLAAAKATPAKAAEKRPAAPDRPTDSEIRQLGLWNEGGTLWEDVHGSHSPHGTWWIRNPNDGSWARYSREPPGKKKR